MKSRSTVRDEQGAVAVMVAMLSVLLLSMAALAVDLGNAVARSTGVQAQADHAALAGGSKLTTSVNASGVPSADVVNEVRDFLNNNQPQDDSDSCWRNTPVDCVASSDLTNGALADGEVQFTAEGMKVTAPASFVDFGFAGVFGGGGADGGIDVSRTATVNVFTAGKLVLPMYALVGCDWGSQTIGSPPPGQLPSVVPDTMQYPNDTNQTTMVAGSQVVTNDSTGAAVTEMAFGGSGYKVSFKAKRFEKTKTVGFFHANGQLISSPTFYAGATGSGTPLTTPYSAPNNNTEVTYSLSVPTGVTGTEGIWWIRVFNEGNGNNPGRWSDRTQALPVRVGAAPVPCDGSSSAGNFGLLDFPRDDMGGNPSGKLAANIVAGTQSPLTVDIHKEADDGICAVTDPGVVYSTDAVRKKDTNCFDTTTGDISSAITPGFITGITVGGTPYEGILDEQDTHDDCDPDGGEDEREFIIQGKPYSINNDTLSCFLDEDLTTDLTTLGSLATPGYSGGPAFTVDLYRSPRFVYVPIVKIKPVSGGSNKYSIVGFRPGFITDEQAAATRNGPFTGNPDESNGVIMNQNDVNQVMVFFFNAAALPVDGDLPLIDYLGTGQPILRLIN